MAEWSNALVSGTNHLDGVGSHPTPVMLHCLKLKVYLPTINSKIIILAGWLSGLNPTPVILHCYKLKVLTAKKQFENNNQHSFNCIDYIARIA